MPSKNPFSSSVSASGSASPDRVDVAIIGAGVMGAATAYWLKRSDPNLSVALIDRDYSFSQASSTLSASSIRQQFSCPVNIQLSQFGIQFLRSVSDYLSCAGEAIDLGLTEPGYLYLASHAQEPGLRAAWDIQSRHGAEIKLLAPSEIAQRFSWLNTDGITLGALGLTGEGWFDGPALHQAFLKKAFASGVVRVQGEVSTIQCTGESGAQGRQADSVVLADGRKISCAVLVNAAGAWSQALVRGLDLELPIGAARRTVFVLSCPEPLSDCPLLIDTSGFWLRPEGRFLIAGMEPRVQEDGLPLDPDYSELDETQWAVMAHRIPALEAMRIERAWAGYYEMNHFDHNAVIGPFQGFKNFYCIAGFSGHGMQHAAGAGLALSEWILTGKPQTIDVRPLGHDRIARGEQLRELNVIG
jgi:FAD-dependent oxidoreductase domain-containing protein 1